MFHNGSMKDNLNFKTLCPLKQKEQTTKISYDNDYRIHVYPDTAGELRMEEYSRTSIGSALKRVGEHSQVCSNWEIYKLLFLLHNIKPVWVEVEILNDNENYDKVFFIHVSSNKKVVILVDNRRRYQTGFLLYKIKHFNNFQFFLLV